MCFRTRTVKHWSLAASRHQLRQLAADSLLPEPTNLLPPLPRTRMVKADISLLPDALPVVLLKQHLLAGLLEDFLKTIMRRGISAGKFDAELSSRLNRFNSEADLPPVSHCILFDGENSPYSNAYFLGQYGFDSGDFRFHYRIDPLTFSSTVAHELTHLEQDYLFICLLSDFLGIGAIPSSDKLSRLGRLVEDNLGLQVSQEKLLRFLNHRRGRVLTEAQKNRATLITKAFRVAPYYKSLFQESAKARNLAPGLGWFERFDYLRFWQGLSENPELLPLGLRKSFQETLFFLKTEGQAADLSKVGRNFYRLLRYYEEASSALYSDLLFLWKRHLYFEREAYAVGNKFGRHS